MDLNQINTYLPLIAAPSYVVVLVVLLSRRLPRGNQTRWFLLFLAVSLIWELILFFTQNNIFIPVVLLGTLFIGKTTEAYSGRVIPRHWFIIGLIITTLLILATLTLTLLPTNTSSPLLLDITKILSASTWLFSVFLMLKTLWQAYQTVRLPLHANRLLHWAVFLTLTLLGEVLLLNNQPLSALIGQIIRFLGVLGLTRAISSHRLFDVQTRFRHILAFTIIALTAAIPATLVLLLTIWITNQLALEQLSTYGALLIVIALGFLLYQPFRQIIERIIYRFLLGEEFQTSKVVRSYSQAISRTLDVEQLTLVIIGTISELMETNRGALLLVSQVDNMLEIEPIPAMGRIPRRTMRFPTNSLFIEKLASERSWLLQYDLDFSPDHATLPGEEQTWLHELGIEVYVPVHTGTELSGIIALGPKSSGLAYRSNELELVQILADQTVIALQNARLYSELNHQNEQIRLLNANLRKQNERLGIMDKVKSDFITIASHELRTPLTQVKGYADILAAMNEESSLTREQTREIVGHINRASNRLEGLISAMLDVSQLEASGMQLSFVQTRLDTIIRLAVEPIATAVRERRLKLALPDLRDFPPIYADFKRLVQAFNNLIGNAIKYTPDLGSITITASILPSANQGPEYVEIVVGDTGIGIDPRYHDLIFEKFFRIGNPELHSSGTTKFKGAGPGLGLHIAKGVIEAHSGRIWVESEGEDEVRLSGSRFHVILPINPPAIKHKVNDLQQGK